MKCLVCLTPTKVLTHEDVHVHACPAGHGSWMQPEDLLIAVRTDPASGGRTNTRDEVDSILEVQEHDVEPGDDIRVCPMDGKPMGSVRYAYSTDVIIDACPDHGIWLDAGELDALEAWAAARFASTPAPASIHEPAAAARHHHAPATAPAIPSDTLSAPDGQRPAFVSWLRGHLGR